MSVSVTGKLNKAASQFQIEGGMGFGLRLGVKYYCRESKSEKWTNYELAVFAKVPAQIQFYQQALVEGSIVEVGGDKLAVKQFQGQNGLQLSIEILDAKIGYVFNPNQQPAQQSPMQQQPAYNQAPQQQYGQAPQYQQQPQQPVYNQAPQQQQYNQQPAPQQYGNQRG